ncbi:AAA family ATPase [Enterococcus entomosocium]|uniref:AAA family ATPase n=1 Tax=Enterococcus entomosocium TaxID=3034352 RepID=UPI003D6AA589
MEEFNSLSDIAQKLKISNNKITLLYAFNATGKTRLSMEFKNLVNEKNESEEITKHVIYYNAFTEDLFYWDNDLENNLERKLKININSTFITLIERQGKENDIAERFKEFTSSKIEPTIDTSTGEVTFTLPTGDDDAVENIKISKGEESIFIWSVFYVLMETIIAELNIDESDDRSTDEFNEIQYIFIDDPISSLDDNHTIDAAINLKELISRSRNEDLKFIVSTHHALFYNVLYNETCRDNSIKKKAYYCLKKNSNNYMLENQKDSPFGYHLIVKQEIQNAIEEGRVEKYHFSLFRNLLEKTATYLGYNNWGDLLTGDIVNEENKQGYIRRINLYSHNKHSELESKELIPAEKEMLKVLFNSFESEYRWKVIRND